MYEHVLQKLGLTKNESLIYETLLREGECSVGRIAVKSKIHRRNVYDTIKRLVELGLVHEILSLRERIFQAEEPRRLYSLLDEQAGRLQQAIPRLEQLYHQQGVEQRVMIYRGAEGWKNYMRDMLREADEAYFIGAKGAWLDERVQHFFPYFDEQSAKKGIRFYHLFDYEVREQLPEILEHVGKDYKFLPKGYSAGSAVDIFADRVVMIPELYIGGHGEEIRLIVLVNPQLAEAFRSWFRFMWSICPAPDAS